MAQGVEAGRVAHMATTRTRKTPEQRAAFYEAKAKAARKSVQEAERARETRRKIILGGALLEMAGGTHSRRADAQAMIDLIVPNLIRPHDRAAFDLPPMDDGEPSPGIEGR